MIFIVPLRITKDTPTTHNEISKRELKRARREKKRTGRVKKFKRKKTLKTKRRKKSKKMKGGAWSLKYKRSINCKKPKGFSQRQHCKYGRKKTLKKSRKKKSSKSNK